MSDHATVMLESTGLRAEISGQGAELVRLQDAEGRDLLWGGDPAVWAWHAPLLFPIVGRVVGDVITVDGTTYPLKQHGIARHSSFELVETSSSACRFRLSSDAGTLAAFPFAFRLDVDYALHDASLSVAAHVRNADTRDMPVSFGFHPAFRWPLPYGAPRESHAVTFEHAETAGIRRLVGGVMVAERFPSPVQHRQLALNDALFEVDAVVFDAPASRRVRYGAPQGPAIEVSFPDMPQLGLWSKPGAGFVCIEPWQGTASPDDFTGELRDKPGMVMIAPGETRRFAMTITLV
jgi:galactose mutarotase-like enzyme